MENLGDLIRLVVKFRDQRNWRQFHNPKDVTLSLVLESAELMEHFQWKNEMEMQEHILVHKEDISDELADVFYWVLLMANDLDIDLEKALKAKLKKNAAKYPVKKSKGSHKKYTELK